jgi:hypothetical protein
MMARISSTGVPAIARRRAGDSLNAAASRGSQAVEMIIGRKSRLPKSLVGTPYHPTTSGLVSRASMAESIQR